MEPQYGAEVTDKNGRSLGTINYVVRDTWSGEIRKFMIYRKAPETDLVMTTEDIAEATENTVKLKVSVEELDERQEE
jgi:sporulation protein YlmC with PRC-barrel domain